MITSPLGGMRLQVLHNAAGDICGLVTRPEAAPPATFSPPPGLMLSEVDATGIAIPLEESDALERFTELMSHHQLIPGTARQLIRRSGHQRSD